MLAIGAQTGPVFLTPRLVLRRRTGRSDDGRAPLDFVAADGVRHVVWTMAPAVHAPVAAAFSDIPCLYIADGHHRAASAPGRVGRSPRRGAGEHDRVLAVAFPDNQLQILPYHRVVRDLNGLDVEEFVAAVGRILPIVGTAAPVARHGHVSMYGRAVVRRRPGIRIRRDDGRRITGREPPADRRARATAEHP